MTKIQFLKVLLFILAALTISATAYGFWKINKDIDKATIETTKTMIQPKTESEAVFPILPVEGEPQSEETESIEPEIDTADWKTYRNEEYRFQIRYPNNWIKKDYGLNVIIFPYNLEETREHPFIGVSIKPNPENKDIREFYNGVKERDLFAQSDDKYEKGQIKKYPYFKFVPYITFAGEVIIVVQLNDAFIELVDSGAAYQQNAIFNSICSTLEFLE